MKTLKSKFTVIKSVIITLLSLIGFSSCEILPATEYGTPHADFSFSGKIKSTENQPIKGIKVIFQNGYINTQTNQVTIRENMGSVFSDENASYKFEKSTSVSGEIFIITTEDIDGEANGGKFKKNEIIVNLSEFKKLKKGKKWYSGKFGSEKDIILTKE